MAPCRDCRSAAAGTWLCEDARWGSRQPEESDGNRGTEGDRPGGSAGSPSPRLRARGRPPPLRPRLGQPRAAGGRAADLLGAVPRDLRADPDQALRRGDARLPRLPDPAQWRPRPVQGRHALPSRGRHRRGSRARLDDDLEDRRRRDPLRRRQGRSQRRYPRPQGARARGDRPGDDGQDREAGRAQPRHPRARHRHQCPDDGLADGRVRQAQRPHARASSPASRSRSRAPTGARPQPGAAAS